MILAIGVFHNRKAIMSWKEQQRAIKPSQPVFLCGWEHFEEKFLYSEYRHQIFLFDDVKEYCEFLLT